MHGLFSRVVLVVSDIVFRVQRKRKKSQRKRYIFYEQFYFNFDIQWSLINLGSTLVPGKIVQINETSRQLNEIKYERSYILFLRTIALKVKHLD
jgi:hypothetical protein